MGTELVNWEERLANEAKQIATIERPSLTSISTRSGMMSINGVAVPGNKMDCVILSSVFENQYYDTVYVAGEVRPPRCFSLSLTKENRKPHEAVKEPMGLECDICPMFAWGSDPKPNSKGKACKEKRRLALLPAGAVQNGEIMKAEMAILSLPVTSVRNWGNYVNLVAAEYGRPPWALLTEIALTPHMKNQFEVKFTARGVVNNEYLNELSKRAEGALTVLMTPYDMTPVPETPKAAPAKTSKKF